MVVGTGLVAGIVEMDIVRFSYQGKAWMVHRLLYTLLVGPIPDELVLDHKCKDRACCNPSHVEPVTQKVNVERGQAVLFK